MDEKPLDVAIREAETNVFKLRKDKDAIIDKLTQEECHLRNLYSERDKILAEERERRIWQ